MTLPYLPFARPTLDEASIQGVAEVLRSGWITAGPHVQGFEAALSAYHGGRPTRVVSSATAALEIALQLTGIGPGDEVLTPAQTFFAAPNMILKVGATPVFVDVERATRNIDLDAAQARITARTKAIMPTHFAGLPVDMDRLYALARKHDLRVIEDAALAIGSSWKGQRIGSFGDICVFSFHPNKNITTVEGGALVVGSEVEAKRIDVLRFHGIERLPDGTRDCVFPGGKFNLSNANARIGVAQLARLPEFNERRRSLVAHYFAHWPHRSRMRAAASRPRRRRATATAGTCSRRCSRSSACASIASSSARRWKRAASAPACRTRPRISRPHTVISATVAATCRTPSTSPTPR